MANKKTKSDNKGAIIGVCAAVVVLVVVIVAVVLATGGAKKLDDSYFVSDGSKYVVTVEASEMLAEEGQEDSLPLKTHMVYEYSGDDITGIKAYAEYSDNAAAKAAYESFKANGADVSKIEIDGKYLIETLDASEYEGVKAADIKQLVETREAAKNGNYQNVVESTSDEAGSGETVEVTTEENAQQ